MMDTGRAVLKNRTETMTNNRPTYTQEFREGAVELLRTSGKPLAQVARELRISDNSLRNWKAKLLGVSGVPGSGAVGDAAGHSASAEQLWEDNVRLRREVGYLKRQRDILKKAASILAQDPQLGMQ